VAEQGDKAPIAWIPRDAATARSWPRPTITIADLIGEVDPIKVAEGRYLGGRADHPLRPLAPHAPRDLRHQRAAGLAERIQVGLLNIMEERDVQIRGYKVRLPLDLFVVASANPEDYTTAAASSRRSRPLRLADPDALPASRADEMAIMEAERTRSAPTASRRARPST